MTPTPGATRFRPIVRLVGLLVLAAGAWMAWPQSLHGAVAYVRVDGRSMTPTFDNGDLAIVRRQSSYDVGDAVAYRIPRGEFGAGALVIHRLVGGDGVHGYVTRGDNRTIVDAWHPRSDDIIGRVRWHVPGAGSKFAALSQPLYLGALMASLTVAMMLLPSKSQRCSERRHRRPSGLVKPVTESGQC